MSSSPPTEVTLKETLRVLTEERNLFLAGKVVVFKWRNEQGWPVEYVSPNVGEVLGYTVEQFISGDVGYDSIIHPEDIERVYEEVLAVADSGTNSFTHEDYRVIDGDGNVLWLYDHTMLLRDRDGNVLHYLGYIIDNTERKLAQQERQRLQSQKLEAMQLLTGGIAHDFNNILVAVLGNADIARRLLPKDSSVQNNLETIQIAAKRLADLSHQILVFSGKGQFVVRTLDIPTEIDEMIELLQAAVPKNVTLRREFGPKTPCVESDPTRFRQVVMNLIVNASQAIGSGAGEVVIRTGKAHLDLRALRATLLGDELRPGWYAFLEVRDPGVGMDEETLERIFDPFFSTKGTGHGLGLAVVQGILHGHGGTLEVHSTPGEGTMFRLYFPAVQEKVETALPEPAALPEHRYHGTVLFVDDEELVRDAGSLMLREVGFDVVTACDGVEGLAVFSSDPDRFSLAIVDLSMPNMDGNTCMQELRHLRPDLPVVLSSGYDADSVLENCSENDCPLFIQKPYSLKELRAVLARVWKSNGDRASAAPQGSGR